MTTSGRISIIVFFTFLLFQTVAISQDRTGPHGSVAPTKPVQVPRNWIGYRLGLKPPTLRAVGKATNFVSVTEIPVILRDPQHRPRVTTESANLMAMGPDGTIYEVMYKPADFRRLAAEMKRLGFADASVERESAVGAVSSRPSSSGLA